MRMGKNFRIGLLGAAMGIAAAMPASANMIIYNVSSGVQSTDWSSTLSVPMFNPSQGTLNSVTVTLTGTVSGSLALSNTGTFTDVATQTNAVPGTPAPITGTTTKSSKSVTGLTSAVTSKLFVGEVITGPGIPSGTTVASVGTTSITLSKNATASGSGTLNLACTASKCSKWSLSYNAAPPSVIPTNTVNSSLAASITLKAGPSNTIALLPSVGLTDVLDYGPKYSPDGYGFTSTYDGSPLTLAQAMALAPPGGIPAPSGGTSNPCLLQLFGPCTVGANTYDTGVTHSGLSNTQSDFLVFNTPVDLSMFIGSGMYDFLVSASGFSDHSGGGNIAFLSETDALGSVQVVYSYTPAPEPMTLSLAAAGLAGLGALRRRKKTNN